MFLPGHRPRHRNLAADAQPDSESLQPFYDGRDSRLTTYLDITDYLLDHVRQGLHVCAVFYGHPASSSFLSPAPWRAPPAAKVFRRSMLPGISAEDCLFADLASTPARKGCQTFEATDFLIFHRTFDPRNALVLWQVGVLGEVGYKIFAVTAEARCSGREAAGGLSARSSCLRLRGGALSGLRSADHPHHPLRPRRQHDHSITTLYIPPLSQRKPDLELRHGSVSQPISSSAASR